MAFKDFIEKLKSIFVKSVYNPEWRCLSCGKEIFDGQKFCQKCLDSLPYNDRYICNHCGRKVIAPEPYCSTCKGKLTSIDMARSFFVYEKPVSNMIQGFKYSNKQYLSDYFASCLSKIYFNNYFRADFLVYVPMTKKAEQKRGYNQSRLLCEGLSKIVNVPILDCLVKEKETKRQATLTKTERLKNLEKAFKVVDKKSVKDKVLVLVDDVTTTGSTAEVIAERLKKAGAKNVYLITVASVPPLEKY